MATIANLLQRKLTISLPEILTGSAEDLFKKSPSLLRDVVLFIHIDFDLKGRELNGYVALIMDLPSIETHLLNEESTYCFARGDLDARISRVHR